MKILNIYKLSSDSCLIRREKQSMGYDGKDLIKQFISTSMDGRVFSSSSNSYIKLKLWEPCSSSCGQPFQGITVPEKHVSYGEAPTADSQDLISPAVVLFLFFVATISSKNMQLMVHILMTHNDFKKRGGERQKWLPATQVINALAVTAEIFIK